MPAHRREPRFDDLKQDGKMVELFGHEMEPQDQSPCPRGDR
jgi:hypothetical protein